MTASTAANSIGLSRAPLPALACVQDMNATTAMAVNGATRRASRPARTRMSPVVLSDRNVAP